MIHAKAEHKRQAWPQSKKKRKRTKLHFLVVSGNVIGRSALQ